MSDDDPDLSRLMPDFPASWHGHGLPDNVLHRAGADLARLAEAFRTLPPPPFDLQVHHFAPLLEALTDA